MRIMWECWRSFRPIQFPQQRVAQIKGDPDGCDIGLFTFQYFPVVSSRSLVKHRTARFGISTLGRACLAPILSFLQSELDHVWHKGTLSPFMATRYHQHAWDVTDERVDYQLLKAGLAVHQFAEHLA